MKAHPLDPISLVAGLVFASLGLVASAGGLTQLRSLQAVGPVLLLVLGALLVGSALAAARPGPAPVGTERFDGPLDLEPDGPVQDDDDADGVGVGGGTDAAAQADRLD